MKSTARRARKPVAVATVATLLAGIATWSGGAAAHGAESPLPGFVLPVPATDVSATDTDLDSTAREVVVVTEGAEGPTVTKLRARTATEAKALAATLNKQPGVTAALNRSYELPTEPDHRATQPKSEGRGFALPLGRSDQGIHTMAATLPSEQYGPYQWGMQAVNAESAWTVSHGARVTVAVIDSGVDATHPDLAGHVAPQIDVVPDGLTGAVDAHGTHVAGIIAASLNGTGVAGLSDKATILPIRVFGAGEGADGYTIAQGIVEAVDRGATVINMSLGGPASTSVEAAVEYAVDAGVTVVASGGNEYEDGNPVTYPANYPGVLGVSSIDPDGYSSDFANTGSYIDLAAPGEHILSTVPGGWAYADGTSMAAPFVSATAALVRAANPTLTGTQVTDVLTTTALDDLDGDGWDGVFGYGLVQADKAASKAARAPGGILAARPVSVSVAKAGYGNVLAVNVNPDRGSSNYAFRVQKKATNGTWTTLSPVYRTEGSAETKSITLGAGTYRVVVPAAAGYAARTSSAVTLTAPTVKVGTGRDSAKSKLKVDVNPNKGKGYWKFTVQKKTSTGWKSLTTYKTKGSSETRTVNLKAGTYRVVVAGKYGYLGTASAPVTLVK